MIGRKITISDSIKKICEDCCLRVGDDLLPELNDITSHKAVLSVLPDKVDMTLKA